MQTLKFGMGWIILPHNLLGMWLLIHALLKLIHINEWRSIIQQTQWSPLLWRGFIYGASINGQFETQIRIVKLKSLWSWTWSHDKGQWGDTLEKVPYKQVEICVPTTRVWKYLSSIINNTNSSAPRKMAAISQTTYPKAFSWMKSFIFWFEFHWSLFLRIQLTMCEHWFR